MGALDIERKRIGLPTSDEVPHVTVMNTFAKLFTFRALESIITRFFTPLAKAFWILKLAFNIRHLYHLNREVLLVEV